jgi:hypothetical protein
MYTLQEFYSITTNEHQIDEHEESVLLFICSFFFNFDHFLFTQCTRDNHTLVDLLNTIQTKFYVFTNFVDFKKNLRTHISYKKRKKSNFLFYRSMIILIRMIFFIT